MMNLLKINLLSLTFLFLTIQVGNAQTLKAAAEGINAFTQWATSPEVSMMEGDYNGDGKSDIALPRQTNGWGTVHSSLNSNSSSVTFSRTSNTASE